MQLHEAKRIVGSEPPESLNVFFEHICDLSEFLWAQYGVIIIDFSEIVSSFAIPVLFKPAYRIISVLFLHFKLLSLGNDKLCAVMAELTVMAAEALMSRH